MLTSKLADSNCDGEVCGVVAAEIIELRSIGLSAVHLEGLNDVSPLEEGDRARAACVDPGLVAVLLHLG
ncbi:MAG: hypothetical protein EBZ49_16840 [Proteobacteria bacterium]|nr:hypothetical protein [Pseudomonadota bacterium]